MASAQAWGADLAKQIDIGENFARTGKESEVNKIIESLTKQPDGKLYAELLIARIDALSGAKEKKSGGILKSFASPDAIKKMPLALQLSYADTLRIRNRLDESAEIANRIGNEQNGLIKVKAGEILSDIFTCRKDWEKSLQWIDFSIKSLEGFKYTDEDKSYLTSLNIKKNKIEQIIELLTHGLGFKLYRSGNEQRFGKRYADAILTYSKIVDLHEKNKGKEIPDISSIDDPKIEEFPIPDIYAAAAQIYRGECYLLMGKYNEARKSLIESEKDILDPYHGEALRLLGDITLDDSGNVEIAMGYYTNAIQSLKEGEKNARTFERYNVPIASIEKTKPPAEMRKYSGWGNLEWSKIEADQVINADTCSWYTDYQIMQAQIKRSICYFIAGKKDQAIEDLNIISTVDKHDKDLTDRNLPSNFLRLRDGYKSGRLYASKSELAEFSGRDLVRLIEAEVMFETEQWDAAINQYSKIASSSNSLSKGQRAYLDYARACALVFWGRPKDAGQFTQGFTGSKPLYYETASYWRSLFLLGNINSKEEITILSNGASNCPDPSLKIDFMMRIGQLHFTGERNNEAMQVFNKIVSITSDSDFRKRAATQYISLIEDRLKSNINQSADKGK